MKNRQIIKGVIARIFAVVLLVGASAVVISYSLGAFEIPFVRRTPRPVYPSDISSIEDSIRNVETGQPLVTGSGTSDATSSADPGTGSPGTAEETLPGGSEQAESTNSPDVTTGEPSGTSTIPPQNPVLLSDFVSAGYKITDAVWTGGMKLAEIRLNEQNVAYHDVGSKKTGTQFVAGEGGILFTATQKVTSVRASVELYMGYIIVSAGKRDATAIFPKYEPSPENPSLLVRRESRDTVKGKDAVVIYSSYGALIGVYPAADVVPAYTRDTSDRPLFIYGGRYYYIDELTGDFLESDYIDERDNRGLYFDYPARYGAPDAKIKKWAVSTTLTHSIMIDKKEVYARFAVNWRLAKQICLADARYADIIAKSSKPFAYALKLAKAVIAEESRAAKTAVTTVITTPAATVPDETTILPDETTLLPEDVTQPEDTSSPETETESTAGAGTDETGTSAEQTSLEQTGSDTGSTTAQAEPETTTVPVSTEEPRDLLELTTRYDKWRFIFSTTRPAVNPDKVLSISDKQSYYYTENISWTSGYRYAKAFNFSGNYAVVVDDLGHLGVINRNGSYTAYKNKTDSSTSATLGFISRIYYTEPVLKDARSLGSYYFDNNLIRIREITVPDYYEGFYVSDRDILISYNGKEYSLPSEYTLSAYSDGIAILEKDGLFGCYSTVLEKWIADPVFTSAEPFMEGLCVLGLSDGTKGVVDRDGIVVIPFSDGYSEIRSASSGIIACYSAGAGWKIFAKVKK